MTRGPYNPRAIADLPADQKTKQNGPRPMTLSALAEKYADKWPAHNSASLQELTGREPERIEDLIKFMEEALATGLVADTEEATARAYRTIENLRIQLLGSCNDYSR